MSAAVSARLLRIVAARSLNTFGRAVINAAVVWELYGDTANFLVVAGVLTLRALFDVLRRRPQGAR